MRVLVVEDDAEVQEFLLRVLREAAWAPDAASEVVGTILLPLTARKFQKNRNTRSLKDKGMQQEPEDAAGAYEKFYKINSPDEKEKI